MIKILFIGDIFGKTGIRAVQTELPLLQASEKIALVIANAENTTGCRGLNQADYLALQAAGIDFFTMGNHTWHKLAILSLLKNQTNIIRPYNLRKDFAHHNVGVGTKTITVANCKIQITNLLGSSVVFKTPIQTNPFVAMNHIVKTYPNHFHFVDFHSETTSEKNAFFQAFQNQAHVVVGTHTHVPTNDAKIVKNTAYITDVGMTGPAEGVIGANPAQLIPYFYGENEYFKLQEATGTYQFCAVLITLDPSKHTVINIKPIVKYEQKVH